MISINDIRNWPENKKKECELFFPELIRRLIYESGKGKVVSLEFNIGDGTAYSGFDGYFELSSPILNLPKGKFLVEVGTDKSIKSKCDSDYTSSKGKGKDLDHKNIHFMFCTPRLFSKASSWKSSKRTDNFWKDIFVINASLIESWLSVCPISSMWLAVEQKLIFGHPNLETLETYWRRHFTYDQSKIFKHSFVVGNRTGEKEELLDLLDQPSINVIKSSSQLESISFVVACLLESGNNNGVGFRSILVHSHEILRDSGTYNGKLVFICTFLDISWFNIAIQNGHTVVYPTYDTNLISIGNIVRLQYLNSSSIIKGLEEVNISYNESQRISHRSFREVELVLHLLDLISIKLIWNERESIKRLMPAIILGSWDEDFSGDKAVIEILSGTNYIEYIESIKEFINGSISPIIKQGTLYKFKYQFLAWNQYENYNLELDGEAIEVIAIEMFQSENPVLALEPKARPWANIRGIKHSYSNTIYENFLHSLIIISQSNIQFGGQSAKQFIDVIVNQILRTTNSQIWKTNSSFLKLLAEASPDVFLENIRSKLEQSDIEIFKLFEEESDAFLFPNVYHTDLLRAFEALSWYPEYFEESVFCLAIMASKDPGGSVSNRPINSLKEIFKPWNPQTTVNESNRTKVLRRLSTFTPQIVKEILFSIIDSDRSGMLNSTFEYRILPQEKSKVNFWLAVELAVDLIIELNNLEDGDLEQVCNSLFRVPIEPRSKLIKLLKDSFDNNSTLEGLHTCLGLNISHHLQFPNADWALPASELKEVYDLYKSQLESYPHTELKAAFSNRPFFLSKRKQDDISSFEKLFQNRLSLLKEFYKTNDFTRFITFASIVEDKYMFGNVIGKLIRRISEVDEFISYCTTSPTLYLAIQGFAAKKAYVNSEKWVIDKYKNLIQDSPRNIPLINLLLGVNPSKNVWMYIKTLEEKFFNEYWSNVRPIFWNLDSSDIECGIDNLYKLDRGNAIINVCWMAKAKISTEYLIKVLADLGYGRLKLINQVNQYEVTVLIDELYQRNINSYENDVLNIEFIFFDLVSRQGGRVKYPKLLLKKISTDEKFMIDLIKWAYKPDTEAKKEQNKESEENENRAIIAWKILYNLQENILISDPENADIGAFKAYIMNLRILGVEYDRLNKVDSYIGKILGLLKVNEKWPPRFVCEILESINSEAMFRGFETALYNGSGIRTYWGSGINRNLRKAKRFKEYADKIRFDFPMVSKSLDNASESANNSARFWENKERQDWIKGY